jgi:hypothetical protein
LFEDIDSAVPTNTLVIASGQDYSHHARLPIAMLHFHTGASVPENVLENNDVALFIDSTVKFDSLTTDHANSVTAVINSITERLSENAASLCDHQVHVVDFEGLPHNHGHVHGQEHKEEEGKRHKGWAPKPRP